MRPSATAGPAASASYGRGGRAGRASLFDQPDHASRGLLDREVRDLDHRAAQPSVNRFCSLELVVDGDELRVPAVVAAEPPRPLLADLSEPPGFDCEADDLERVDLKERRRWLDPLDDRHVRGLVAEVAEVHR